MKKSVMIFYFLSFSCFGKELQEIRTLPKIFAPLTWNMSIGDLKIAFPDVNQNGAAKAVEIVGVKTNLKARDVTIFTMKTTEFSLSNLNKKYFGDKCNVLVNYVADKKMARIRIFPGFSKMENETTYSAWAPIYKSLKKEMERELGQPTTIFSGPFLECNDPKGKICLWDEGQYEITLDIDDDYESEEWNVTLDATYKDINAWSNDVNLNEMLNEIKKSMSRSESFINVLWYKGSDKKYDYFRYVADGFGAEDYKIPLGQLVIPEAKILTGDNEKWSLVKSIGDSWHPSRRDNNGWEKDVESSEVGLKIEIAHGKN